MEEQSYLSEIEFNPVAASTGKRFLNYVVDVFAYYILAAIILVLFNILNYSRLSSETTGLAILFDIIFLFSYFIYYAVSEIVFKGRTIGKFVRGTKVVNEDGTQMLSKTVLLRTLCRLVPFEPFSALGTPPHPWHDKWSHTVVIDVKKSQIIS